MGLGGISVWQLLIILLIVVVLFGTKRLSTIGKDLGGAVKGFRRLLTRSAPNRSQATTRTPQRVGKRKAQTRLIKIDV